jgi:uncharacterized integral membrane protein
MSNKSITGKIHFLIAVIGVFCIVLFTLQNSEVVSVNFLWWKLEMSRVLLILITFLVGFLTGYITRSSRKSKRP